MAKKTWIAFGRGQSCSPIVPDKSFLQITAAGPESIREGDYIVFTRSGEAICHRVIRREKRDGTLCFLTRGDNQEHEDGWVPQQAIVGKVAAIEQWPTDSPTFRLIARLFLSRYTAYYLVGNGRSSLVGRALWKILKYIGSSQRKT